MSGFDLGKSVSDLIMNMNQTAPTLNEQCPRLARIVTDFFGH